MEILSLCGLCFFLCLEAGERKKGFVCLLLLVLFFFVGEGGRSVLGVEIVIYFN